MSKSLQKLLSVSRPWQGVARLFGAVALGGVCCLVGCNALFSQPAGNTKQPGAPPTTAMNESTETVNTAARSFYDVLSTSLSERGLALESVCDRKDPMAQRVLQEYGALFVVGPSVKAPPVCVFADEEAVQQFQQTATFKAANPGNGTIELQPAALDALLAARAAAQQQGLDITPRGGADSARRSFADTLRLWETRFTPALAHWQQAGRLPPEQAAQMRQMDWREQVRAVLELEKGGMFFSKDFSKSVFYSVAAPGTSQHLSMLALDVTQFANPRVREILAQHGWFQTVQSDLPHFTFLGLPEAELPEHGLRQVKSGGQTFWIPNI